MTIDPKEIAAAWNDAVNIREDDGTFPYFITDEIDPDTFAFTYVYAKTGDKKMALDAIGLDWFKYTEG